MAEATRPGVLVLGVGNELRGDDGVGVEVARRLGARPPMRGIEVLLAGGEATELLELWRGRDAVVLVDAMRSGRPPGSVVRLDATREALPARPAGSSHALGVAAAIELARALDRLPATLLAYTVEGTAFELGEGLSGAVEAVAAQVATNVLGDARRLAGHPPNVGGRPPADAGLTRISGSWPETSLACPQSKESGCTAT